MGRDSSFTAACRLRTGDSAPAGQGACPLAEPQSAEEAYEQYFEIVWRNLRRLGIRESAVEDATQDVFLVVHRRWSEFERRSSVKTWVIGICLHVARQYWREKSRTAHEQEAIEDTFPSQQDAARDIEQLQVVRRLMAVLDRLNESQRVILVLVELEELTVAEAAQAMDIPASTAYKRLRQAHRAFERLWSQQVARDEWRFR